MIKNKPELYHSIREDYLEKEKTDVRESFIYKYLRSTKDARAESNSLSRKAYDDYISSPGRKDSYIGLRSAYLAFVADIISEEEYRAVLDSIPEKKKRKATSDDIHEAQAQFEHSLILDQIRSFFSNTGIRRVRYDDYTGCDEKRMYENKYDNDPKHPNYSDDIDMLYRFAQHTSGRNSQAEPERSAVSGNVRSREYIDKCSVLYRVLLKQKADRVFVPLVIDPLSDMGVFIVGTDYLLPEDTDELPGYDCACYVCIVSFCNITRSREYLKIFRNDLFGGDEGETVRPVMSAERYDSVAEAFRKYEMLVSEPGDPACDGFQNVNYTEIPVSVIDPDFRKYFFFRAKPSAESGIRNIVEAQHSEEIKATAHAKMIEFEKRRRAAKKR